MVEKTGAKQNLPKTYHSPIRRYSGDIFGKRLKKESRQLCQEPKISLDEVSRWKEGGTEKDMDIMQYIL